MYGPVKPPLSKPVAFRCLKILSIFLYFLERRKRISTANASPFCFDISQALCGKAAGNRTGTVEMHGMLHTEQHKPHSIQGLVLPCAGRRHGGSAHHPAKLLKKA